VLQRANGGSANEVKALEGESVITGQTYRVKIVVDGARIELYLDGELQMTYDQADASQKLFQVVTRDVASGDLVAKVVNTATSPVRTQVEVSDVEIEPTGTAITMSGPVGATNTKADPATVVPKQRQVSGLSSSFEYEFPASSVTFLRMHTADAVAPVVSDLAVAGLAENGWYADPATVQVSATDDRSVDHLEVSVDGGDPTTIDGASGQVEVSGDGLHTVEVVAVDAAGNTGEVRPLTFGIDATAPVSKATLDAQTRTVELAAVDAGAGLERIEYRLDGGAWTTYDVPVELGAAATTLEHRAVDRLGNVEDAGTLEVPAAGDEPAASVTAATPVADQVALGATARVAVRVSGADGVPTGPVTLLEGGTTLAAATLVDGRATLSVRATTLGLGAHSLTVAYAGNATYAASDDTVRIQVTKARSTTTVSAPAEITTRQRATVSVRVTAALPVTGSAKVVVRQDGRVVVTRTVTLSGGRASVELPRLDRGRYRVTATYTGSATVSGSVGSDVLRVTRAG
jgi:hypothetical protein